MPITIVKQPGRVTVVREEVASPGVTVSPREVIVTPVPSTEIEVPTSPREVVIRQGGMQGPAGENGTGDSHYRHVQGAASLFWVIDHPLGKYPAVSVVDSGGSQVEGHVQYVSADRVTITFTAAFAGEAYLN